MTWREANALTLISPPARGYKLSFESPKNDKLALFEHGERAYDHLILFPPKSKGRRWTAFRVQDTADRQAWVRR